MQNLVIVESPTKARTLAKFLGNKYQIEASRGHIRDLPKSEMGVDLEKDFEPRYIIPRDKKKRVNELKKISAKAKTIYLATDPDREGEAIAWHINYLLKEDPKNKADTKRVVFHEITEDAIKEAFEHPQEIDLKLVDAQQARRVLDRIVGYKLSPLLWKKVKRGLSAGRVQTVALRLIVEREREIEKFVPTEHWSIEVELESRIKNQESRFLVKLVEINGEKIGLEENQKNLLNNQQQTDVHVQNLENSHYQVSSVVKKEVRRTSAPPFITSTLQQTAGNKLGFTAKKTMMIAQNLYEQGLITYMRTDSVNLSTQAVFAARNFIESQYGQNYLPASPKIFKSKSKNAQEAHEAIRPTNVKVLSDELKDKSGLTRDHARLYDLIWKRMVASQMADAIMDQTTVEVAASLNGEFVNSTNESTNQPINEYLLRATGSILKFEGWLKVYGIHEEEENADGEKKQTLPELEDREQLNKIQVLPEQHFTEPPPRYTEASLIKKLEELEIGRPSTYAPTLSTIQERFYVEREDRKFKPTILGVTVTDFLIRYFPEVFDYSFTASMEDALDQISRGEREWKKTLKEFYHPFEGQVEQTLESAQKVDLPVETVDKNCPECGKQLIIRTGKFGKFLACSGFPECKHTEPLEEKIEMPCPKCGGQIVLRRTKKGKPFYGCKSYPSYNFASWTKPKA